MEERIEVMVRDEEGEGLEGVEVSLLGAVGALDDAGEGVDEVEPELV